MVKNEEDVIGGVIRHLLAEGVDNVIVADNLSSDRTRGILEELAETLPITVVDDPEPAYWQSQKMTALARRAGKAGAEWVIPFDADELWIAQGTTLRQYFSELDGEVAEADAYDHFAPLIRFRHDPFLEMRRRSTVPGLPKVAFRYADDVEIAIGNHNVESPRALRRVHDGRLQVRHFGLRSYPHMLRKYRNGQRVLELTDLDEATVWHWRLHGRRSAVRMAVTWARMSLRRRGRVVDPCVPRATGDGGC
jgi:glycosyltransferase involved in cell wall biosynthesis